MHGRSFRFLSLLCLALLVGCERASPPPTPSGAGDAPTVSIAHALSSTESSPLLAAGRSVGLRATVHASEPDDAWRFSWTAPAGHFETPTAAETRWTAPQGSGPVPLTVTVTDAGGRVSVASLSVRITEDTGEVEVEALAVRQFRVAALTSSQSLLEVGRATTLTALVADAQGASLTYAWSATCEGDFEPAHAATTRFVPTRLPAEACHNCRVDLTVSNGLQQVHGSLALCVTAPADEGTPAHVQVPPRILRVSQTYENKGRESFALEVVVAHAPEGGPVTYTWTPHTGQLGFIARTRTRSRATWYAPQCVPAGEQAGASVTVTPAHGPSATHRFLVSNVPTCAEPRLGPP